MSQTSLLCNLSANLMDSVHEMENVDQISTCPTPGLSLVEFTKDRVKWRVWDMSGQGRFRNLWGYYSGHVQAIVFVVDVADDRVAVARDELQTLLDQPRVKESKLPILLFANKQDLSSMDEEGITGQNSNKSKSLTLDNIRVAFGTDSIALNQKCRIIASSSLTGVGVAEGFSWLNEAIRSTQKGVKARTRS